MAKFKCEFQDYSADLSASGKGELSVDELLEVLRPAALRLKEFYQETIRRRFKQRTGSLADSIDIEDYYFRSSGEASIVVKPFGKHKGGSITRKSRAGSPTRRYAKHNRAVSAKAISNEELGYLLENGTPRISATHWMENANDEIGNTIQDMVEQEYDELLKKKGLI